MPPAGAAHAMPEQLPADAAPGSDIKPPQIPPTADGTPGDTSARKISRRAGGGEQTKRYGRQGATRWWSNETVERGYATQEQNGQGEEGKYAGRNRHTAGRDKGDMAI